MELGKLEEVDLRSIWPHEQKDFSNWLAKEEGISLLGEVLGLNLINVQKEVLVGSFPCDLYAVDEFSDLKVVIENQLEQSNHDHLGKIITYASGLDANVIVWIVKHAREEHKSAIEWLNNNTNNNVNFFLLEIHAQKIGNSLPAPIFKIIEEPNDFIKGKNVIGASKELNKTQQERLNFWNLMNERLIELGKPFNTRKSTTRAWYDVAIGSKTGHIAIELVNKEGYIRVGLYIVNDHEFYDRLFAAKDKIEAELGIPLVWVRESSGDVSRIKYELKGLNFNNKNNYNKLINDTITIAAKMKRVFSEYV